MLRVEHRRMFCINGLIDDFVLHGDSNDYLEFAKAVKSVLQSEAPATLLTESLFRIEVTGDTESSELFTSLQNQDNDYLSMNDWEQRDILRVWGNATVLRQLHKFLKQLPEHGVGYSYISEYSEKYPYNKFSPQWRLHVL